MFFQDRFVTAEQIHIPWDDRRRIAPDRGSASHRTAADQIKGRHDHRDKTFVVFLFQFHIMQVLTVEGIGIREVHGRSAEDLGITGPAHTLVTLRAIRRHVEEIALHAPFTVFDQPVDLLVAGIQCADRFKITVEGNAAEIRRLNVMQTLRFHIAIPIKCKLRPQHMFIAVGYVHIFRFGGTQIVAVEITFLQNLTCLQTDHSTFRLMNAQCKCAGNVLFQIKHRFTGRRCQDLRHKGLMGFQRQTVRIDRRRHAFCQPALFFRQNRQCVVTMLTVVNIGERDIGASYFPAFVAADDFLTAVFIEQMQFRDQPETFAITEFRKGIETESAQIPAIAKLYFQCTVFTHHVCYVIGLRLQEIIIVIAVWRQIFFADPDAVIKCFIEPQAADIQSGFIDFTGKTDFLLENRVSVTSVTCDPFSRPFFCHLAGFKRFSL